jgi:hypothetical protein
VKQALTLGEVRKLRQLYDQLGDAAAVAAEALGKASPAPVGLTLQRFCDRVARVDAIVEQIKQILG